MLFYHDSHHFFLLIKFDKNKFCFHQYRNKKDYYYSNYDEFDDEFDDDFSISDRQKTTRQSSLENLPNEIKILMMTDFFDTKF